MEDVVVTRGKGLGGGFVLVDGGGEQGQGALAPHVPSRAQTVGAPDSAFHIIAEHAASSSSPVLLPREKSSSPEELSEYIHVPHASAGGFPSVREVGLAKQGREAGHVGGSKPTTANPSKAVSLIFSPRRNSPRAAPSACRPVGPQANDAALGSLAGTSGRLPSADGAALGSLAGTSGRAKSPESPRLSGVSSRRAAEKQVPSSSPPFPFLHSFLLRLSLFPSLPLSLFPLSQSVFSSSQLFKLLLLFIFYTQSPSLPGSLSSSPAIRPFPPLSNPEPIPCSQHPPNLPPHALTISSPPPSLAPPSPLTSPSRPLSPNYPPTHLMLTPFFLFPHPPFHRRRKPGG
jgi:hypothetical protein